MFILAVIHVEVLDSHVELLYLELGTVGAVVHPLSAMPAVYVSDWRRVGTRFPWASLHECDPIVVWVLDALLPRWHLIIVEEACSLHDGLRIVILSLCHVVREIDLELVVPAVVQSLQDHAR